MSAANLPEPVREARLVEMLRSHRNYLVKYAALFPEGSCMATEIDEMIGLAEAHARDAARYRWLKDNDQFDPYSQTDDISFAFATYTGSVLDGAIDAAMQEPQP